MLLLRSVKKITKQKSSVATNVFPYSFFLSADVVKSFHKTSCQRNFPVFGTAIGKLSTNRLWDSQGLCSMQLATSPDRSVN